MASRYVAEVLQANLMVAMGDQDVDEAQLAWRSRVDRSVIRAALAADAEHYPCPTSIHRMAYALGTTPDQLLSNGV